MNTQRAIKITAFFALAALLAGCTGPTKAYSGDLLPDEQTAMVKPQGVTLRRVNGVDIGATSSGARIRAGRNEIELTIDASNFTATDIDANTYKLRLEAQPGVTYAITGQRGDARLCAFPLDEQTGLPNFNAPAGCIYRE